MNQKLTYQQQKERICELEKVIRLKEERIAYLERMLYGDKKDRKKDVQEGPGLFDDQFQQAVDEREASLDKAAQDIEEEAERRRAASKKSGSRKRPSRYQYAGLPEEWHTVYPEGICLEDYDVVGKDVTRILHRSPARVWVECVERPVLRLKSEKNANSVHMVQAAAPVAIIGGNHVAADLLAQLVVDKFVYAIPEYRQIKIFADHGVAFPASTINDWIHAVAQKLYPLYESQAEIVRESDYLQIDEVPWRINDTPGKACRKGYAWQFLDARPKSVGTYFYYHKGSRAGEIPRAQLRDFSGAVQTDGYGVYDYFEKVENVTLLSCMAHVRRKFVEAQDNHPKAAVAVKYIGSLYALEENLKTRGASFDEIRKERQEKAIPLMDEMEKWIEDVQYEATPEDSFGKALSYAYKLWPRLKHYAEDGRYNIDNNPVERGQRPTVMGRKNFLFSKNNKCAEDNAVFYTLLESCKIVGINPLQWLTDILNKINVNMEEEELRRLLPCNYKSDLE